MAAARSETDREVTSQQLDAFHKTFNFCMTCRQYTCGNCWNEAEGRCLTCAPHLGHEIMPAPFPRPRPPTATSPPAAANGRERRPTATPPSRSRPWPGRRCDLERDARADDPSRARRRRAGRADRRRRPPGRAGRARQPSSTTRPSGDRGATPPMPAEAAGRAGGRRSSRSRPSADAGRARRRGRGRAGRRRARRPVDHGAPPRPPTQTNDLMQRFRPGQNLDAEIEAYEREQAGSPTPADPARWPPPRPPAASTSPRACPSIPDVARSRVEAPSRRRPGARARRRGRARRRRRADVVEQPTWRIVAPDPETAPPVDPTPGGGAARPGRPPRGPSPQWPAAAGVAEPAPGRRPAVPRSTGRSRPAASRPLWAESAREVVSRRCPERPRPEGRRRRRSRASAAGCHSPPPPGSAGAAGPARADRRPARRTPRPWIDSSRTRTQAAPYSSAWNVNDSQARAMNAVASDPASAGRPDEPRREEQEQLAEQRRWRSRR